MGYSKGKCRNLCTTKKRYMIFFLIYIALLKKLTFFKIPAISFRHTAIRCLLAHKRIKAYLHSSLGVPFFGK